MSREKIREYVDAVGGGGATSVADTGHAVAPPTFAACFTIARGGDLLLADPELGAHPNLVHGNQEFEFHRVVRAGDVLDCTPSITSIVSRGRSELLTLQIDCSDAASDEPVVTSRATLVFFAPAVDEPGHQSS